MNFKTLSFLTLALAATLAYVRAEDEGQALSGEEGNAFNFDYAGEGDDGFGAAEEE